LAEKRAVKTQIEKKPPRGLFSFNVLDFRGEEKNEASEVRGLKCLLEKAANSGIFPFKDFSECYCSFGAIGQILDNPLRKGRESLRWFLQVGRQVVIGEILENWWRFFWVHGHISF